MKLSYKADPYIDTIFARMLESVPDGSFYAKSGTVIPYRLGVTELVLETEYIGQIHNLKSDTVPPVNFPFIPDSSPYTIRVQLERGVQDIRVEAVNPDTRMAEDVAILPVTIADFATLLYASAKSIVNEWISAIDLYNQLMSGYQLVSFESSLAMSIRDLLPFDYNTKLLSLKNLMRVATLGSSSEGIEAFITAVCDMNPPKIVRYMNREEIQPTRIENTHTENTVQDVKVWFGSFAMGRRAVLNRLINNFPERYAGLSNAGNNFLVIDSTLKFPESPIPSDNAIFIDLTEKEDSALTDALDIDGGNLIGGSTDSETFIFIPNYEWRDYEVYHYMNPDYEPLDVGLYGDQRWFHSTMGALDRRAEIYIVPDLPESRLDDYDWPVDQATFHYADETLRHEYGLNPLPDITREQFEAVDEMHLGHRNNAGDKLILDVNVGRTQSWFTDDYRFDMENDKIVGDFHQGLHAMAFAWTETTIEMPSASLPPYLLPDGEGSISALIMPYFSRPTEPGSRPTLDYPAHYSENELFRVSPFGNYNSPELWMSSQKIRQLPQHLYNDVSGSSEVSYIDTYHMLTMGWVESEINPYSWECNGVKGRLHCVDVADPQDILDRGLLDSGGNRKLQMGFFRLPDGQTLLAIAFNVGYERGSKHFLTQVEYGTGTARMVLPDRRSYAVELIAGGGTATFTPYGDNQYMDVSWQEGQSVIVVLSTISPPPNASVRLVSHNQGVRMLHLLNTLGASPNEAPIANANIVLMRE